MNAASSRYRILATLVTALVSGVAIAALVAAAPARSGGSDELLPDLRVVRDHGAHLARGEDKLWLRLANTVANQGTGPLEIFPGDEEDDCNPPGTINVGRRAFQRVFLDDPSAGSDGYFERTDDTAAEVLNAGCMRFHPDHGHWHFDDFARYEVRKLPSRKLVGARNKVGFCLFDGFSVFADLPGAPDQGFYPHAPQNPGTSCSATSINGLSIGWADLYGASIQGQAVNVTGIKPGKFCLISTADPANRIVELAEGNNSRGTRLRIHPRKGTVRELAGTCSAPG